MKTERFTGEMKDLQENLKVYKRTKWFTGELKGLQEN